MEDPRFAADPNLSRALNHYLRHGLAPSTVAAYGKAVDRYAVFLAEFGLILPGRAFRFPSENDILYFIASLNDKGLAVGTIKGVLSGLGHFCRLQVGQSPLIDAVGNPYPRVQQLLRAIKLAHGKPRRERLPVTTDLLRRVHDLLLSEGRPDSLVYRTAFAVAVYALLRVSEFVCPGVASFDPERQANLQDLQVHPSLDAPTRATLLIRASKTDPFRNQHLVTMYATGQPDCPVMTAAMYLRANAHRQPNEPLFRLAGGKNLTRGRVSDQLRDCMTKLGFDARSYAPHSFRIGGTVSCAAAGVPTYVLSILGRWSSTCYLSYLKLTPGLLADVYSRMGKVTPARVASGGGRGYR